MDQQELDKHWYSWEPIEGVEYGFNDAILILGGPRAGEGGSIISLLSTNPVTYVVELGPGEGDVEIAESNLKLIEKYQPDGEDG
jgi:hypothetical protein